MKQQELRIGNYVKYNGSIVSVYAISNPTPNKDEHFDNKVRVTLWCNGLIDATIDEIEPIPITEEWQTKIGFILPKHKEFYVMCRINGKDNSIRLTRYFNLWNAEIFASHPEVVMLEHTIKGLRFVHELQNAYYLVAGKELDIKI